MTSTFEHASQAELEAKLCAALQQLGYIVLKSPKMETPAQVAARFGLPASSLSKRLKSFPGQFPGRTGESGRILSLHVTPELAAWLEATPSRFR